MWATEVIRQIIKAEDPKYEATDDEYKSLREKIMNLNIIDKKNY